MKEMQETLDLLNYKISVCENAVLKRAGITTNRGLSQFPGINKQRDRSLDNGNT
jgi:hypothetical protein